MQHANQQFWIWVCLCKTDICLVQVVINFMIVEPYQTDVRMY